jgi:pimeloyl-ACP methyl ester carboxylesterase
VRYRSGELELDLLQRALRVAGVERPLQPQVFGFLSYLIQHRDRVVSKQELQGALWPDVVVSEGSLQRVASQARSALGEAGRASIRTFSGHGYRWVAEVTQLAPLRASAAPAARAPKPRYARHGDVHLAYTAQGEGDTDIVLVLGWAFPMQALFELPETARLVTELSALGRVVLFDKRGTGLSDRVKELPTLEQRVDDLRAVLDAVGSRRAVLLGVSEGGPLSIAFARAHAARVAGLLLVGAFARFASAADHPHGWKHSQVAQLRGYVGSRWGEGATVLALVPQAAQARAKAWAQAAEQAGASPGAALDLVEMNLAIDVREQLAELRVPCVVLLARGDRVIAPEQGRLLAARIAGARLVEVDGDDHAFLFEGRARLLEELRALMPR